MSTTAVAARRKPTNDKRFDATSKYEYPQLVSSKPDPLNRLSKKQSPYVSGNTGAAKRRSSITKSSLVKLPVGSHSLGQDPTCTENNSRTNSRSKTNGALLPISKSQEVVGNQKTLAALKKKDKSSFKRNKVHSSSTDTISYSKPLVTHTRAHTPPHLFKEYASTPRHLKLREAAVVERETASFEQTKRNDPKALVGLQNLGNTWYVVLYIYICAVESYTNEHVYSFMNACLQCLLNIPLLAKYFYSNMHSDVININSSTKGKLAR